MISASDEDSFVTCFSSSNPLSLFATDLGILMLVQSHSGLLPDLHEQSEEDTIRHDNHLLRLAREKVSSPGYY